LKPRIILTCEHANYLTPEFINPENQFSKKILESHLGWDKGAFDVCIDLKKSLKADFYFFPISRLYIDANRSKMKNIQSPLFQALQPSEQKNLLIQYYKYRAKVTERINQSLTKKQNVFIFSIHSFVPIFKGKKRKTDFGILFRPKIAKENLLAQSLRKELITSFGNQSFNIHFNRPYRGHTDCFLNDLLDANIRNKKANGLFLEFNQKILKSKKKRKLIVSTLCQQFKLIINSSF
tara:strand:+ start:2725 stop:3432 length:708 start_codon:yes stop_codon:yes gene_type:complete